LAALGMEKAGTVTDPLAIRQAIPKVVPFPESLRESSPLTKREINFTFVLADFIGGKVGSTWPRFTRKGPSGDRIPKISLQAS